MNEMKDWTVLVVGARKRCAHTASAMALAQGASVILLDKHDERLDQCYDSLAERFGIDPGTTRLAASPLDLGKATEGECAGLRDALARDYGAINAIILDCAALCPPQGLGELSAHDWRHCLDANLTAPWLIVRALLGLVRKSAQRRIVFLVDDTDGPWLGAYALSRAAQLHLARAWAREHKPARAGSRDPVIAAVLVSALATEARRYYYPGLGDEALQEACAIEPALGRALHAPAAEVHGRVLSPGGEPRGSGAQ